MRSRPLYSTVKVEYFEIPDGKQSKVNLKEHLDNLPGNINTESENEHEHQHYFTLFILLFQVIRCQFLLILSLYDILEVNELKRDINYSDGQIKTDETSLSELEPLNLINQVLYIQVLHRKLHFY